MKLEQYQKDLIILAYPLVKNKELIEYLNISINTLYNYVQKYKLKKYTHVKIGDRFGIYTVIKICNSRLKNKKTVLCRCICGKTRKIITQNLYTNSYLKCSCKKEKDVQEIVLLYKSGKCLRFISDIYGLSSNTIRRILISNNVRLRDKNYFIANGGGHRTGYKQIKGSLWKLYMWSAKKRDLPFAITIEDVWELFIKQNKKCALTGEYLYFDTYAKRGSGNASLDRIDSSKGYVLGNIQWVTKKVNIIKRELSQEEFLCLCRKVVDYEKINSESYVSNSCDR